jgi:CDP-diacylglycerol--glycerol-3-phosphate 3-phosphatidyltransferase
LITANMVTFARLLPMPAVAWMFYENHLWTALWVGTLIGCTDFVDGYLARKHGPTVLGGLLDPIADKVFIAFTYMPTADLGIVPAWAVALMFVRELMVTALRSSYERRDMQMKTSYLGKVKTWTQMQGIGMLFIFLLLNDGHRDILLGLLITASALPLVALAVLWIVKRRFWMGAIVMSVIQAPLIFLHLHGDLALTIEVMLLAVIGITWLSGFDYVMMGVRNLRGRGDFDRADAARLLSSVAIPALVFAALVETPASVWPLVAIISMELAVGGLDNLLSHHKAGASATSLILRVLGTAGLLAGSLIAANQGAGDLAKWLALAASVACFLGVAYEFWRGRRYYLDPKKRDKQQAGASVEAA